MMLYASTGLLAVLSLTFSSKFDVANLVPAVLGAIVAFVWLQINRASVYLEGRWHEDFEAIVQADSILAGFGRIQNHVFNGH